MKNIRVVFSENFRFLEVKFSIYLNRRVFLMIWKMFFDLLDNNGMLSVLIRTASMRRF